MTAGEPLGSIPPFLFDLVCKLWFLGRQEGHWSAFTLWQDESSNMTLLIRELISLVANGVSSLVCQKFALC